MGIVERIKASLLVKKNGEFKNDQSGFMAIVNQVIGLGLVAIILILMVMVYARISPSVSVGVTNTEALAAIASINNNTYSGFSLAAITPTVMAAGIVIMVILGFIGYMYQGRQAE